MEILSSEKLSLEAGAAHLTQLLKRQATGEKLPPSLQSQGRSLAEQADLRELFTLQTHKEDWKYTPMDFFRYPWQLGTLIDKPFPWSFPAELPEAEEVPATERVTALDSLPAPTSPWEALLNPAADLSHYAVARKGRLTLAPYNAGHAAVRALTFSVEPGGEGEIWLSPQGAGLTLLRIHLHIKRAGRLRLFYPTAGSSTPSFFYLLLTAEVEQDATLETYDLAASTPWKRSEIRVKLVGPGATAHLHGASVVSADCVLDQAIRVEHAAEHTQSNQLFKTLVHAGGRSAFQGRIFVHRGAQKTNAYQSHKALLWEPGAVAYSRPQLEIFADDVRCTHGVTKGFLQGDMLMYLRTRGVPEAQARQLLAQGFLNEVLEKVPYPTLQTEMREAMGLELTA